MNRRVFLQSAFLTSACLALPLAAPTPAAAFGGNLRLVLDAVNDPSTRPIWVCGPARSGKTRIADRLDDMLSGHGPLLVMSPYGKQRSFMSLRGRAFRHIIIDDHELFSRAEGDVAHLATNRTLLWRQGKVIVFSREEPPTYFASVRHVRLQAV